MELIVALVALGVLVAPFAALAFAFKARKQARALEVELHETQSRIERIERRLSKLVRKLREVDASTIDPSSEQAEPVISRTQAPEGLPSFAASVCATTNGESDASQLAESDLTNSAGPTENVNHPPLAFDWEGLVGVRLFAWLGGGALFLGAALFLHYSIQHNLIAPPVRVAIGLVTGALLLASSDRMRVKASMASQAVAGAGIGTLYASLYAARVLYHLLPLGATYAGMILVTLTGGLLSVKRCAYVIAVLGLIGGMATPFLLSTGEDHPWSLFAYVALLDMAILYVAAKRDWPTLALLGLIASILVFIAWSSQYLYPHRAPYALVAISLIGVLYCGLLFANRAPFESGASGTVRTLTHVAIATPLLTAFMFTHLSHLHVHPGFLTIYLVVVSSLAWLMAPRLKSPSAAPAAAGVAVLVLLGRVDFDLFPSHCISTLSYFCLLPLAQAIAAWLLRKSEAERSLRHALLIVLSAPLLIGPTVLNTQHMEPPLWPIVAYAALNVVGLLTLALLDQKPRLVALAEVIALVTLSATAIAHSPQSLLGLACATALSGLAFWALPLRSVRLVQARSGLYAAALSLPLHYTLLYLMTTERWGSGPLGFISIVGGGLMLVGVRRVRGGLELSDRDRLAFTALFSALALAFLTASLPILLEKQWITLAFALEVAALAWLRRRIAHDGLLIAIGVLAGVVTVRLLLNPALLVYQPRTSVPIFNFYLYTFGVSAAAFLIAARWLANDPAAQKFYLRTLLRWAAIILVFVLVNIEVADYFSVGSIVTFRLTGGGLAQDMTYSLVWGLFALTLLVLGIYLREKALRIGALLVLVGTVAKVFLHDLWQLGELYRVGSILGLAFALLVVSYLTQRFILRGETS